MFVGKIETHYHFHFGDCDTLQKLSDKLSAVENHLKEQIMSGTEDVLAAVAVEKQEVADAQAAKDAVIAERDAKIVELNAKIDELTAGGGATPAELEVIKAAIADIITPAA